MRSLEHEGVTTLFGYPGGAIMPVYDALYGYKDKLNHVLVRHEQGATHAAQGYARVSGKVGVALVTSGPGGDEHHYRYCGCHDGQYAHRGDCRAGRCFFVGV